MQCTLLLYLLGEFFVLQIKNTMMIMIRTIRTAPISAPITPPAIAPALEEACGRGSVGGSDALEPPLTVVVVGGCVRIGG